MNWIIGILTAVIILIVAMWVNEDIFSVNFSIASNGFTIALALVAIFISLKQDSDSQRLNSQMNATLGRMDGKLDVVEKKVNQIDVGFFKDVLYQKVDENFTQIQQEKNDKSYSQEELNTILEDHKKELLGDIDEMVNVMNMNFMPYNYNENFINYNTNYSVGELVYHKKWGKGEVIKVKGEGQATEIEVEFLSPVGRKKLLVRFAPLTKL